MVHFCLLLVGMAGLSTAQVTPGTIEFDGVGLSQSEITINGVFFGHSDGGASWAGWLGEDRFGNPAPEVDADAIGPDPSTDARFVSADGSEFELDALDFDNFSSQIFDAVIIGYRDGSQVASKTETLSQTGGGNWVTITFGSDFENIDEVRVATNGYSSSNPSGLAMDNVVVDDAVSNTAPTFTPGSSTSLTVDEDASATSLSSQLEVDDPDGGQTLEWTVSAAPSNGSLSGFPTTASSGTGVQPTGVTYEPNTDFSGSDAFDIQVADGNGGSATITVNVTVNNLAPVFNSSSSASFAENGTGTALDVNADNGGDGSNDSGVDYSITGGTDSGALSVNTSTGELSFDSAPDFENPTDSDTNNDYVVDVTADDGASSNNTTTQTITVTVTDVNEAPTLDVNNAVTVDEGSDANQILNSDLAASDPEQGASNVTYNVTSAVSNGTLFIDGSSGGTDDGTQDGESAVGTGTFTQADIDSGNLLYSHDGSETSGDSFGFDLEDGNGGTTTGNTYSINITAQNDAPTISSISDQTIEEDGTLSSLSFTVDDTETSDLSTLTLSGSSSNTTLVPNSNISFTGPDGSGNASVTVTPASGENGSSTLTVTVDDGAGSNNTASEDFLLTVTPVVIVNDGSLEGSAPCNEEEQSSVSAGISAAGAGRVTVCPGSYSESTLDVTADVTLEAGANVTVTDQLTLSSGTFDATSGTLTLASTGEDASARIAGSGSGTISGDVTAERFIDYAPTDASHWRFMASPFGGALDEVSGGGGSEHDTYSGSPLLSNTWTQGDGVAGANYQSSGADPSVFYYEESRDVSTASNGWTAVGNLTNPTGNSNIKSQEGFAVYLFQDRDFDGTDEDFPITLSATGMVSATANDGSDVTLPVTCTDSDGSSGDGCNDSNDGWNLVANPFLSHFDWSSVSSTALDNAAYVYDADNVEYDISNTSGGDNFIAPFQAFFVKSNAADGSEGTADLKVNSGAKADPGASGDREFKSVEAEPLVSLQLSDGSRAEETRLTFRASAEAGKDRFDAYQLTPLAADYHLLASEIEGRGGTYDSQYRPLPSSDSLTVGLAVTTTRGGSYTIEADTLANVPADLQVKVLDTQTGETADLRAGESLEFTVEGSSTVPSGKTSPRELLAEGPVQKATASGVIDGRFELQVVPYAAIPVELAAFEASKTENEVQLKWQTASETNNAGFAVERQAEGGAWTQVGFREGAGTTEQAQTYRFADTDIPFEAEQVTYRLRQKDLDGTTTLSEEVTVRLGAPSKAELHAPFPNPTSQQVTLRYEVPDGLQGRPLEIAVYDVLGRQLHTVSEEAAEPGRHERQVRVGDLPAGTYFVRVRVGGATETRRLTIVR